MVYFTPDSYPQSAAMVMCSDDNNLSARLEPINEQFEEYAVLVDVLKAVCQQLDIGARPCAPQTSDEHASAPPPGH